MTKLKKGQIIKNYKELCKIMGWKERTSDSKKAQMKEFGTFYDYHKNGQKIIIDRVYEVKKIETSNGEYRKYIQVLLLDLLARSEGNHIDLPIKRLLRNLEMVNDNYINGYDYYSNFIKISEITKVDSDIVGDVYHLINNNFVKLVNRALLDLSNRALIDYKRKMVVCISEKIYKKDVLSGQIILDKNNKPIIIDYQEKHIDADDNSREHVLKSEREVLRKMNIKNKQFLNINREARRKFNAMVEKEVREKYNKDFKFYYYVYDIVYNSYNINEELKRSDLAKYRNELNSKSIEQINNSIDYISEKNKLDENVKCLLEDKIIVEQEIVSKAKTVRVKHDYNKDAKKVASILIDRHTRKKL